MQSRATCSIRRTECNIILRINEKSKLRLDCMKHKQRRAQLGLVKGGTSKCVLLFR